MGNALTPNSDETPQYNQEDLNNIEKLHTESEEISKKLFKEIQKQAGNIELRKNKLVDYFNKLISEVYRKPISDLRKRFRIKKNYAVRNDLLYKEIYVVENINSKNLYNLKIFKIPFNLLSDEESEVMDQDIDKFMLQNDLEIMQTFRNANAETLFYFYQDVKKDALNIYVMCTYTTPYTLLDAMNDKIAKNEKFSELEFQQILKFLLEILNKMKNQNIIHRGLCPSAIFFQKKNDYSSLIIRNFYFATNSQSAAKGLTGTLWYSAPEILRDFDQDFKVDLYSVGLILYQVLTLHNPYQNLTKKEDILKKIGDGFIQKSLKRLVKLGYNKLYLETIKKMVIENPNDRYSIDNIISNADIKSIRMRQVKYFLKDYSNLIFNLKMNRNILEKFKETLMNANKGICGLIFHIFESGKHYLMDHPMVIRINILFDFLDVNSNNYVTTDEFRDKLIELLVETEDKEKFKEKKEEVKEYADTFREVIEMIMDNEFFRMNNIDSKQFNFNTFFVVSLILWFYEEKERTKMRKNQEDKALDANNKGLLEKSNNISALNKLANNQNSIHTNNFDNNKNFNTPNYIINKSIGNKNDSKLNPQNITLKNQTGINLNNKTNNNNNNNINALNEKKMNYGRNFDPFKPQCLCKSNEEKITYFVNAFFNTKDLIEFEKFVSDKKKFDPKIFSQIESYLIENYMREDFKIFEIDNEDKKYYVTKENFVKFLEYEFV